MLIAVVVALLQLPYVVHQMQQRSDHGGMDAVSGSLSSVVTGEDSTRFRASATTYAASVNSIEAAPWAVPAPGWVLLACGVLLAIGYRRDPVLLVVTLLPQLLAIAGYAFWVGFLDSYYYLPILPGGRDHRRPRHHGVSSGAGGQGRVHRDAGVRARGCTVARRRGSPVRHAGVSRAREGVARARQHGPADAGPRNERRPPADGRSGVHLPDSGGTFDPASPWIAVIQPDGGVELRRAGRWW